MLSWPGRFRLANWDDDTHRQGFASMQTDSVATTRDSTSEWTVEVFYDGDCPLCKREIATLQWMDRKDRIKFTDISVPDFRAADLGKEMDVLMAEIHGRLPSGQWLVGVEVFRRLYSAVGFGPLVALTRLPLVSHTLDWGYRIFAKNRLRFTGRCSADSCSVGK